LSLHKALGRKRGKPVKETPPGLSSTYPKALKKGERKTITFHVGGGSQRENRKTLRGENQAPGERRQRVVSEVQTEPG